MKVVYVSGKYRDSRGVYYVRQNILAAETAALFIWKNGGVALCPHKNTSLCEGIVPEQVWLDGDLELVNRCDAVYAIARWDESEGAKIEVAHAYDNNIPVLYSESEVLKFLTEQSIEGDSDGISTPA